MYVCMSGDNKNNRLTVIGYVRFNLIIPNNINICTRACTTIIYKLGRYLANTYFKKG